MQIALRGDQRAMPGDLPEHMNRDARIGHPGQPGVAQVVAAQVLIAQAGDHLVPIGGIPQHRRGNPAAAGAGREACCGVTANGVKAFLDERSDFCNQRDGAGSLSFGASVDEAAKAGRGLSPDGPGPGGAIDVGSLLLFCRSYIIAWVWAYGW